MISHFNDIHRDIKKAIYLTDSLDYRINTYIELYCEAVFTNDFWLQITWDGASIAWHRTTWLKNEPFKDREGRGFSARILKEKGRMSLKTMDPVLALISNLSISPICSNRVGGRDGLAFELTIGEGETNSCSKFCWWNASTPPGWEPLDVLAEALLKINKGLEVDNQLFFTLNYEFDNNQNGQMIFCEWA